MKKKIKWLAGAWLLLLLLLCGGCGAAETVEVSTDTATEAEEQASEQQEESTAEVSVEEDGTYTDKEHVAAYLAEYGHLPDNYIRKGDAKKLGWVSSEGNLDEVAPGKSIGGDTFSNYEGTLPEENGRKYHECDINYEGGYRGGERIIYSNDGLIYYTGDHYNTFELLYGEE